MSDASRIIQQNYHLYYTINNKYYYACWYEIEDDLSYIFIFEVCSSDIDWLERNYCTYLCGDQCRFEIMDLSFVV